MSDLIHYDAIIIGAGQSGVPLSTALASAGWKTALVERQHVGGTCINTGCTPTKTMVASAEVAYLANRARDYGVRTGQAEVDMAAVRQRKREMVASFRESTRNRIESASVNLLMGEATFTAPKEVEVKLNEGGKRRLDADRILINTGGRPRIPDIPGLEGAPYLNSTTIMELDEIPEHLLVVGGGYVGLEFAQMFRRFGSRVTIIQRDGQLIPREDPDVAEAVTEILQEDGIEVVLNTEPRSVAEDGNGGLHLALESLAGESAGTDTLKGTHLLIATGRVPNTERLNLPAAGVETDGRGYIQVNDRLETSVDGIYAMGDVKGGPEFTHISYDDYRVLEANLLGDGRASIKDRLVPYVVFIDPQLGRVGLTEKEARARGLDFEVARIDMYYVSRAVEIDQSRGFMKALVDPKSDQILGCAILGVQGGEIMAMIEIAMMAKLPYTALRDGIFTHPTLSEGLNTLFASLD
jgi:pyruvate/2-oxoglutarate dehydrogenase complex dihydrolipoamide dehydrogenase (E3) component